MTSISEASGEIKNLVEKYQRALAEGKEGEFNEERVKLQFIIPFLEVLGWDVSGKEEIDEVKPEHQTIVGPVDFSLMVNGKEKIFFEIKKFSEELSGSRTVKGKKQTYAEQALYYAWHKKVDWAVLTNFKEIRLYYTHVKKPHEGLIFKATFDEYLTPQKLSKIWLLSKEAVSSGLLDREEKRRTRKDIDAAVLEDLFESRRLLTNDVYGKYRGIDTELMKEGIQRMLNRLIVMRFMEDKGIEQSEALGTLFDTYNSTVTNKDAVPFMRYLEPKFLELNKTYNSKVFEPHICDKFAISNRSFGIIIKILYKYNFDLIDADVLGNIYEDYLGHVLEAKGRRGVEIVEKRAKRKEHGIYYTPTYVVDYIVRNTVGALIEEKKLTVLKQKFEGRNEKELRGEEKKKFAKAFLNEINKINILDPACGSGSFLIKAFDVIKEYYEAYGVESKGVMTPEKKILLNNIHGVDLDRQATEIASVNLILKALKKGQKLPLILDENIKCGNSLISGTEEELRKYFGDEWKEKKPFNWNEEFPEVFKNGGFDVVIGNPPYGAELTSGDRKYIGNKYLTSKSYKNTALVFIELAHNLLETGGYLGLIVPKSLAYSQKWHAGRELIKKDLAFIVDVSKAFEKVLLEQVIIILRKGNKESTYIIDDVLNTEKLGPIADKKFVDKTSSLIVHGNRGDFEIFKKMNTSCKYLSAISMTSRGLPFQKHVTKSKTSFSVFRGANIARYLLKDSNEFLEEDSIDESNDKVNFLKQPKVISQRIVAHVTKPKDHIIIMSTLDKVGVLSVDTVENTVLIDKDYSLEFILCLFNAKLISWYAYRYIFSKAVRTMDFDNYYVGKIPIPQEKLDQTPFIEFADKILTLNKQYNETLEVFKKILENMSDSKTDSWSLKDYYPSSDYGISPVESKKLIDIHLSGKVTKLEVFEIGSDIVISGEYFLGEKDKGVPLSDDILLIRFTDPTLKRFFYYTIKTFLLENSKKKVWGKGKIVDIVLKSIKIPRFYNLKMKDVKIIRELMGEFSKASPIGDKSLSEIEKELAETDRMIDKKVYDLYGLTEDEIKVVEGTLGIKES